MRKLIYIIFCLCILAIFYSCNDKQMDEIKTPEVLYEDSLKLRKEQMDRTQLLDNLCKIDSSTTNSVSYIPRHGKVLDETTPTVRYIGVESLEEAEDYFRMSIALLPQEEDADNWRFTDFFEIADFRLEFTESQTSDEIARVAIDCPELKNVLTELVFIPRSLWPENDVSSPFQYGSVWMKEPKAGSYHMDFYICVRPCGYGQKGIMLTFDSGWGSIAYDKCTYFQGKFNLYSNCASLSALDAFYDLINEFPTNKKFKGAIDNIRNKCIEWYALDNETVLEWFGIKDIEKYMREKNTSYDICMKALNKEYLHFNVGSPNPKDPKKAEKYWWSKWRWYYLVDVTYYTMTYNSDNGRYKKSWWTKTFKEKETPYNVWPSNSFEFDYDNYPKDLIKVGK